MGDIMSKTIRCYNKQQWMRRMGYGHSYKQICMGRCKYCRKLTAKEKAWNYKRKRLKNQILKELKQMEVI